MPVTDKSQSVFEVMGKDGGWLRFGAHGEGWPTFVSDQNRMHLRSQPSLQVVDECSALHVEHLADSLNAGK